MTDGVPVRVAVVDSGVHAAHPHVGGVTGGAAFGANAAPQADYVDRIGHGTAVAAVIREKAPAAELFALKVFDRELSAPIASLVAAIDWASANRMHLVNLSLGTGKSEHAAALGAAVARARDRGTLIVAAGEESGSRWLPGSLPGVLRVELDWRCPRDAVRVTVGADGTLIVRASGYPRPIPAVPPERNLKGLSFAVANVSGVLAAALGTGRPLPYEDVRGLLGGRVR